METGERHVSQGEDWPSGVRMWIRALGGGILHFFFPSRLVLVPGLRTLNGVQLVTPHLLRTCFPSLLRSVARESLWFGFQVKGGGRRGRASSELLPEVENQKGSHCSASRSRQWFAIHFPRNENWNTQP